MERFVLEQDSPLTAWGQVHRDLLRRLRTREFKAGQRLPPEASLAESYGVSRMTMRRALEELAAEGMVRKRKGVGTFVAEGSECPRHEVDLLLPWREQLLATGHVARSRLLETSRQDHVPEELAQIVQHDTVETYQFGLHLQEVDGSVIAMTESWIAQSRSFRRNESTEHDPRPHPAFYDMPLTSAVSASSTVQVTLPTARQAERLSCPSDVSLLEITTASRLRTTGELVELARTAWIAERCRFVYRRRLALGQIDMSELLES